MTDKTAYDPVRCETVTLKRCHDVHEASGADDLDDRVVEIKSRSFKHDPCEGCQGRYTLLVAEDCPECGCNRAEESTDTLGGVTTAVCVACGHYLTEP